jgi:hypothetical protein
VRRLAALSVVAVLVLTVAGAATAANVSGRLGKASAKRIASLGQRPAGGRHERQAGALVCRRLETLGYPVSVQRIRLPDGRESRNIVGRTAGPLRVVLVAHLDGVYGTQAANDNGSGVGMVLELARVLRGRPGVLVAALGAEERAVTGSNYHLGSLRLLRSLERAERDTLGLALSLDMVGVGTTLNVRGIEARPNRSARRALRAARELGFAATYLRDSGQSDHAEMSRAGVPAAWLEWRWDSCWHSPCDRPSRLVPHKMYRAGKVALRAARAALAG